MKNKFATVEKFFKLIYNEEPTDFVISPSRINVIGEHIDYLGGKVLPGAIDLYMTCAIKKADSICFTSMNFDTKGYKEFELNQPIVYKPENEYLNYVLGCYKVLKDHGYKVGGFKTVVDSQIPLSSGLSSSAAFGVLVITGIATVYDLKISKVEIAKLFKEVENNFMNLKNGIMDQFIIANGTKNNLMLLDTSTLEFKHIPFNLGDNCFLIINSKKPRNLISSKYNERVAETTEALKIINQKYNFKNLCAIPFEQMDDVLKLIDDPKLKARTRYAIEENNRVNKLVDAIQKSQFEEVGKLLNEGHQGLKNDYEVTSDELDFIHNEGNKIKGVLGVRMTGAGFGGCLIALMNKNATEEFKKILPEKYKKEFGYECEIYETNIVDGATSFK